MVQTSTIVATTVGTLATGFVAYAVYFDYKRRNDPQFRKQLKKESKRQAKVAKEEAEAHTTRQRQAIRSAVEEAKEDGFPSDVEEREAYFMQEVARGEGLAGEGTDNVEAALCFYKALKVYPTPADLITIYDKTVPKAVLDILAEMIAADSELNVGPFAGGPGSDMD
ncbi:probable mitochondrial import receptor subunit tom-20 [Rhynchosporium agropyri]|uniref:Mitochondrial import receptor subunit TOM20 n=3 Tax=Rhynchosporium TaxID=38037 RepID=A0A1E1LZM1_RHYSE|nr:probable mitochondrial import receptor subunit tom-20 [Rhynchosporium agropyri]CZT00008.1 probable mitochondrial import receptor subunit tom-20 [Rhynchosporium commune]CZT42300.1 probable mitochondrial import receptor subunit tom-20 [Rhynchosporium secalis]